MEKIKEKTVLTQAELKVRDDPDGFYGMHGMDAVNALRGSRSDATDKEKIAYALAIGHQAQPGALAVALNTLSEIYRKLTA